MSTSNGHHPMLAIEVMTSLRGRLTKDGSQKEMDTHISLYYKELCSNAKSKINLIWRIPPTQKWYKGTSPGSLLEVKCDRGSQTSLARLTSSHLRFFSFESGRKIHPTCKKCCDHSALSDHILKCIGLSKGSL
ncbi:hypothetical protein TNCV_2143681 [Trichonephila clavipes]|nr:hypothetical protein TNCV_2143681 [Trichonephila clavipes]